VRTFIGGWTFSAIATVHSGLPFTLYWAGDPANTGQGSRPDAGSCSGRISNQSVSEWYDPSCFTAPASYTYGNLGRNTMRADGTANFDLGLYKDFAISEHRRIQFRSEFFNAFNHPTLGVPDNYVNDGASAGVIYSASDPRIIQLAFKIYF